MKKEVKILCLLGCMSGALYSQSNFVATGGNASGSGGSISYSIGQIDYMTITGTGGAMTEGVQQPFVVPTSIIENEVDFTVVIFPNPTSDFIEVIRKDINVNLNYELLDINGRIIERNNLNSFTKTIDMSSLPDGTYYLKVNSDDKMQKTFTIIKIN